MKTSIGALILFGCLISFSSIAQKVSKLTITDNLSTAQKFTLGKAKPAAPKDHFYLLSDKGTQVLFYAELTNTDSASMTNPTLKFTAYTEINGKFEWVDDRVIDVKLNGTFVMTAMNFFSVGSYKIVVTPEESSEILAQGVFTITK